MFVLHERLSADTFEVSDWALSKVLLLNDATYPWLVLVPRREGLKDFHDVAAADHAALMAEIDRASRALQSLHRPDKINVAALGNMVPQLHIHVISRLTTDPAWPGPVWGAVEAAPYDDANRTETVDRLRQVFDETATR